MSFSFFNLCRFLNKEMSCGWFFFFVTTYRRKWHPTPVFLPGEAHCQRSLVGYSPWGCEELDTTERLSIVYNMGKFLVLIEWKQCRRHLTIRFPLKQGSEKQVSYVNAYIWEFRKMVLMNRTILRTQLGKVRVGQIEKVILTYIHNHV